MQLNPEIIQMLKDNESEHVLTNKRANNKKVIVKEFEDGNFLTLWLKDGQDEYDTFNHSTTKFIAMIDKKTHDIIYCLPTFARFESSDTIQNFTDLDENKMNTLSREINKKIAEIMFEKLSALEEEVLEKIDLSKYEKDIEKIYKQKGNLKNPFLSKNFILTPSFMNAYFNDNELFIKKTNELITQKNFKEYEDFVGKKYALINYEKSLMSNPKSIIAKALCDLMNNDSYKTLTVHYRCPNGMLLTEKINKQLATNKNIKKTIIDDGHMCNIPIVLIEKITWGKQEIYNCTNYPELSLSDEDKKFEFAHAGCVADLEADDYKDKSLMKRIIVDNVGCFGYLDNSLKSDPDYLLELAEGLKTNSELEFLYKFVPNHLATNQDFMMKFINNGVKERMSPYSNLPYAIAKKSLIVPYNNRFYNLLLEKFGLSSQHLIEVIPDEFWKLPNTVEFCKNYTGNKINIIGRIDNETDFKAIFTEEEACKHIDLIHDALLKDKYFVSEYLQKETLAQVLQKNKRLIEEYESDEEIKKLLVKNISSRLAVDIYLNKTASSYDSVEHFRLTSENIIFFDTLSTEDKEIFLDGELFDKDEINVFFDANEEKLVVQSPNSIYKITPFGDILMSDYKKHTLRPSNHTFMISCKFLNFLKELYPTCNSKNFRILIKDIIDFEKQKENNIER